VSGAITFTLDGQEVTARPGELVVHPERVVGEEKPAREQRPIRVMITSPPPMAPRSARVRPDRGLDGWHY
jgi:hypothetical protein